jgi:exopolysaccharide production protein ExoQ
MPPQVAAIVYGLLIFWLIRVDARNGVKISGALLLAFVWLLILGSRPVSFWFGGGGTGDLSEGSPIDRNLHLLMAGVAFSILLLRQTKWVNFFQDNLPIFAFYGYLLLTCLWSDYSLVTFKRWFKDISIVFLALLIWSSSRPDQKILALFTRGAAILFILSVLFLKYFPELGRIYSRRGGLQIIGITDQKNTLGEILMIYISVLIWGLLSKRNGTKKQYVPVILIGIGAWLLYQSDSKTAFVCLALATLVLFGDRLPGFVGKPKRFVTVCLIVIPFVMVLNEATNLKGMILEALGRDATFTNRTEIWKVVDDHPVDPLFGNGYLMYWDELGEVTILGNPVELKTGHNGYLDIYLDGGCIALALLIVMLVSVGIKASKAFISGSLMGRLQFAVFVMIVTHNCSESTFARKSTLWFGFILFCLDYSRVFPTAVAEDPKTKVIKVEEAEVLQPA